MTPLPFLPLLSTSQFCTGHDPMCKCELTLCSAFARWRLFRKPSANHTTVGSAFVTLSSTSSIALFSAKPTEKSPDDVVPLSCFILPIQSPVLLRVAGMHVSLTLVEPDFRREVRGWDDDQSSPSTDAAPHSRANG